MKTNKAIDFYIASIICGLWFLYFGTVWTYLINLIIGYPAGLTGLWLWNKAKKLNPESRLNKISLVILIAGLVVSIVALFLYK